MMRSSIIDRARGRLSQGFVRMSRAATITALAVALTAEIMAQGAGTGTVTGRVQNVTNGMYLNNARVTVEGTNKEVFTNEYGEFMLTDIPAGEVKLRVSFTGLDPQIVTVTVPAGQVAEQDVRIGSSTMQSGNTDGDTIMLDQFVVSSQRETNAQAIAANEQRYAPNLKVVVAADAFGDIPEGNVGEFVKYLPGITVDYVAADVRTMSVRGFADNFTNVYVDGVRLASASSGNAQRSFEFEQVSINNAARVEVQKVPTPEYGADTLGGSMNMISKTAFERDRAQLKVRGFVSVNSEDLQFWERTPGPQRRETYKVLPGLDFDLTLPITKKFGIVLTGITSNQFNEQHRSQMSWNFAQGAGSSSGNGTGGTATQLNPYLQSYTLQDGPKNTFRDSLSLRADWKFAPGHVLFATAQTSYYKAVFGNRNITWDVGTNGAPTPASGTPLTWTADSVTSATGRGTVRHGGSFRDKMGAMVGGHVGYNFTGRLWGIESGVHYSKSRSWYRDTGNGHFDEVRTTMLGVSQVSMTGLDGIRPDTLTARTAAGTEIDPRYLVNYRVDTVRSRPVDASDEFEGVYLNVKRELDFLPFEAAIKVGGIIRQQVRDMRRRDITWTYAGPDGLGLSANGATFTANGDENAAPFLDTRYGADPHFGFSQIQWYDPFALYDRFVSNPSHFVQTNDQRRNAARAQVQNSQWFEETSTNAFVQLEGKFLNNRLTVVTGVRYEKTKDKGLGALAVNRGATLDQVLLWKERGLAASQSYDDYYPSLHLTYNITDDLLVRAAYAKTYGRPDFSNIIPAVRVNDDPTQSFDDGLGSIPARTIISNNPSLLPWTADNFDLSLEYYIPQGGVASIGGFWKDLSDFWGTRTGPATAADIEELNLDPSYVGFDLRSPINVGSARIKGVEFNYQQPLKFIGGWARNFSVFANGTKLWLEGSNAADFARFIDRSASWGITYSPNRLSVSLKWNYRGRQKRGAQTGNAYGPASLGFYEYYRPRTMMDLNADYQLSKRFALFLNVRNLLNEPQILERYNDLTPDYARFFNQEEYGVQITAGVKGTF
jgi:iron complex outermembrane recepter protein